MKETQVNKGQMGLEEILIVLITSATIPSILNVIKAWIENRRIEVKIVNNTGKEIHSTANNVKVPDSIINELE